MRLMLPRSRGPTRNEMTLTTFGSPLGVSRRFVRMGRSTLGAAQQCHKNGWCQNVLKLRR